LLILCPTKECVIGVRNPLSPTGTYGDKGKNNCKNGQSQRCGRNIRIRLHSSDIHRCKPGFQLRPVMVELLPAVVARDLRIVVLALQIDASEKFNHGVYERLYVAYILVQRGL
jgi:hypothetical protein